MGIYKVGQKYYIDLYADGRRIRKVVGNKKDAENALAAVKADILRGEFRFKREHRIQFDDFGKKYLEYVKPHKRSWERDERIITIFKSYFKKMLLSKITPLHIEDYIKDRIGQVRPGTVNRELACLKTMFSKAQKWGFVSQNPVKDIKFLGVQKYEIRILKDEEEVGRLIEASKGTIKDIITVALNTGMRKREILNLKWNDIDFDGCFIFVRHTKSGKDRKVPMNSMVIETLKSIKRESPFIFYNPYTKNRLSSIHEPFKNVCKRAGIQNLRFHDLRHTAATLMVIGGVDLVTVKEILGHADIKMTMRYAHPTPENMKRAVNKLGDMFEKSKQKDIADYNAIRARNLTNPSFSYN